MTMSVVYCQLGNPCTCLVKVEHSMWSLHKMSPCHCNDILTSTGYKLIMCILRAGYNSDLVVLAIQMKERIRVLNFMLPQVLE